MLTHSQRSLRAQIGALSMHGRHDVNGVSTPGRVVANARLDARLLAEIDERDPGLPEAERQRRLGYLRKAHFARLALKSWTVRRERSATNIGGGE